MRTNKVDDNTPVREIIVGRPGIPKLLLNNNIFG